jgi:hypothetical protein
MASIEAALAMTLACVISRRVPYYQTFVRKTKEAARVTGGVEKRESKHHEIKKSIFRTVQCGPTHDTNEKKTAV